MGLLMVIGILGALGYVFFINLSQTPPKPNYPAVSKSNKAGSEDLTNVPDVEVNASDSSYVALVVYPDGLMLRKDPDSSSKVVATLKFDETVRVLEISSDEQWEKLFLETTGEEGWASRGNTKRVE